MAEASGLSHELRRVGETVADALGGPGIEGIHLPAPVADETFRDAFGFVFLADGSVGPFYVSLGDLLQRLWDRHPRPRVVQADVSTVLAGLTGRDPAARALAIGTYNALSAALYRAAGFAPPDRGAADAAASMPSRIGMVGYFAPLVERLTAQGHELLILELSPQRVPALPGVTVITDPGRLGACSRVLCTASTLTNDTLGDLLALSSPSVPFELVGPSGSGLPDPVFARGVSTIGGVAFADRDTLLAQLHRGLRWGDVGRKYRLRRQDYPGLAALLRRLSG